MVNMTSYGRLVLAGRGRRSGRRRATGLRRAGLPPGRLVTGSVSMQSQRFAVRVAAAGRGALLVPVPFDPGHVWGTKDRHHIAGTVNGVRVRGVVEQVGDGFGFTLGPAWHRGCGLTVGDEVTVVIAPEGPQRDDLAEDVAAALAANPDAGRFFDSLAQFYRRAYLRWIDATKRRPEQRAERIAEMVELLKSGIKERP
jgi:hypothetical protein